jgi:hypothetical protein
MISEPTQQQLAALELSQDRPLLICDVDEVIVHFTQGFESFLAERGLWLEAKSLALFGNVKTIADNHVIAEETVSHLIDSFFGERTKHMDPIEGAIEALQSFAPLANIVLLTNLPHFAREDRVTNLQNLGLEYPVISNSGPKGPAIKNLAARTKRAVVFVDDSPHFIQSAYDHAPHLNLVHFLHDERFAVHTPRLDFVSLRTNSWATAKPHITAVLHQS